jgi:titin
MLLDWQDRSSNETGFRIRLKTGNSPFRERRQVPAGTSWFLDHGLASGTTHTYQVSAFNQRGEAPAPDTAQAATYPQAPQPPARLEAAADSGSRVTISWTHRRGNETGFEIERKGGSPSAAYVKIGEAGAGIDTFVDSRLTPGSTYTYRVRTYNAGGSSRWAPEQRVTTPPLPGAPGDLRAEATTLPGSVLLRLSWRDDSRGEDGFKIERSTDGRDWEEMREFPRPDTTTWVDRDAQPGHTYRYRVRAYSAAGHSAYSGEARVETRRGARSGEH